MKYFRKLYGLILLLIILLTGPTFTVWAQTDLEYQTCPTGGAAGVPTDIAVDIVFNQNITLATADGITMTAASGVSIDFTPRVDQYVLWLHDPRDPNYHEYPLPDVDTISVHIPAACIADQEGNLLPGDIDFSFTTTSTQAHFIANFATPGATTSGGNHPPVANPDYYTVTSGNTLNINTPGVLGNDSDADGDSLNAAVVDHPDHGTLTLKIDGSFIYIPHGGFTGTDTYTYKANDGSIDSNTATVTIEVKPGPSGGDNTSDGSNSVPSSRNSETPGDNSVPGSRNSETPETVTVPESAPNAPYYKTNETPVPAPVVTPQLPNTGVNPVNSSGGWRLPAGIYMGVLLLIKSRFKCR